MSHECRSVPSVALWFQYAVYVAANLAYKLIIVDLFLLVISLNVLFPLGFYYSAEKRVEILIFKIKSNIAMLYGLKI